MSDYGIKVTLPGKGITSTDPRDYVFSSKYGTVKVWSEPPSKTYQTVTVNAGSYADITITHGLGFIPLVLLYVEINGHWYMGADRSLDASDPKTVTSYPSVSNTYVDSTYIKIRIANTGVSNVTIKYYYFIFADNG